MIWIILMTVACILTGFMIYRIGYNKGFNTAFDVLADAYEEMIDGMCNDCIKIKKQ